MIVGIVNYGEEELRLKRTCRHDQALVLWAYDHRILYAFRFLTSADISARAQAQMAVCGKALEDAAK